MMHTLRRFGILGLLAVGLALRVDLGVGSPIHIVAHAASALPIHKQADNGFEAEVRVIPSRSPGSAVNELLAVETISASDIWAVGDTQNTGGPQRTLIEHWNGRRWMVVPGPSPGSVSNALTAINAVSPNDIWAVGDFTNTAGTNFQTLIEHWDGISWSVVSSPNPGSVRNFLEGIEVVSANDIWAVGNFETPTARNTLIEHWNGVSWSVVASPSPSNNSSLVGIEAVSANDIWAVGTFQQFVAPFNFLTLIEHWDGTNWTVIPSPNPGSSTNTLSAVESISSADVWAVGTFSNTPGSSQTLVEHWNGTTWSVIPSANPGLLRNALFGVETISANDIWAVGNSQNTAGGVDRTLIEHWDGSAWSVIKSPSPGSNFNTLFAIEAVSPTDLWAVGEFESNAGPIKTLVERISVERED